MAGGSRTEHRYPTGSEPLQRVEATVGQVLGEGIDVGLAYRDARLRVSEMVTIAELRAAMAAGDGVAQRLVPHCPDWTVRETLAHLVGIVDDAIHGKLDGVATEAWTAAQVVKRRDKTITELLGEWTTNAPLFEAVVSERGLALTQPVFDIAIHEHDLRHALQCAGARDSTAVVLGVRFAVDVLSRRMSNAALAPLQLVVDGQRLFPGIDDGATELRATAFDALRVCGSRRSERQIRALDWSGPIPPVSTFTAFGVPADDIDEG